MHERGLSCSSLVGAEICGRIVFNGTFKIKKNPFLVLVLYKLDQIY